MINLARALGTSSIAVLAACAGDRDGDAVVENMLQVEHAATIGGEVAEARGDAPLQMPAHLRLDARGRIWTLDTGRKAALAFAPEGRLDVAAGRSGRGPGELLTTMALDVAPDGSVWILDVGNAKAVRHVEGNAEREFRLDGPPGGIVALGEEVWIAGDLHRSVFMRYTSSGELLGLVGTPVDTLRQAFRTNQGIAARGSDACRVLWAYTYHSRVDCYAGDGSLVWTASPPVSVRPQRSADPEAMGEEEVFAYTDLGAWDGRVHALFVGRPVGDRGLKTDRLHVFSEADGRFLGEQLLPRPAHHFARNDSVLVLLEYSPVPAIHSYRFVD